MSHRITAMRNSGESDSSASCSLPPRWSVEQFFRASGGVGYLPVNCSAVVGVDGWSSDWVGVRFLCAPVDVEVGDHPHSHLSKDAAPVGVEGSAALNKASCVRSCASWGLPVIRSDTVY